MKITRLISLILIFVTLAGTISAFAFADEGSISVNGEIQASVVSFSVPTSIMFVVDPNSSDAFPDFQITNTCNAPLKVSVSSFNEDADSPVIFTDVLGSHYSDAEWSNLNKTDSTNYFALALLAKTPGQWNTLSYGQPLYAKTVQEGVTVLGTINPNTAVDMTLTAKHGKSIASALAPEYVVTFMFELAD